MFNKIIVLMFVFFYALMSYGQNENKDNPQSQNSPFSQLKFNPDISLILDFSYVCRNINNTDYKRLQIPKLVESIQKEESEGHSHEGSNLRNGFNFNYGELIFSSSVDPYFDMTADFHFSESGIEVEEAYISTKNLILGLQMRVGKFLSGFGRINSQHAHSFDFVDQPLIFKTIFGDEGLNEKGLRMTLIPAFPFYLTAGFELLEGNNEKSFGRHDNFTTISIKDTSFPYLMTGFIKTSFDLNDLTFLIGASSAFGKALKTEGEDSSGKELEVLQGNSTILGADITLKNQIDSYAYLSIQGEYVYRKIKGTLYEKDTLDNVTQDKIKTIVSGFYFQVVLKFDKQWKIGGRYEMLDLKGLNLPKYSAMIDYSPSEFSRLRLQYNYDKSWFLDNIKKINHEIIFQLNMAIGSHGAHSF